MNFKQTPIGQMNSRINLQSATISTSSTGEIIKSWTTYTTLWAYIRTLTGNEKYAAQQVQTTVSHEVTIRWSSDVAEVKPTDRILFGSRIFDIKDVRNVDENNIEIRLLCAEAID